ncbi:hypothetical protein FRB94_010518 [Tulasnella sp. JGI-2019a]|nr:hypothetical protein FRB94_010518 [Tulasnella sp. JGI-2019a]KAG9035590.1 hypothetical protein FRB95_010996 [Tulasnella sp. JGI-2019a]
MVWYLQLGVTPYTNSSLTNLQFAIDGKQVGTSNYSSSPYGNYPTTSFGYNTSVYQNFAIPDGQHPFSMYLQPSSIVLFDYAIAYQNGSSTSNIPQPSCKKAPIGAIVGGLIAGDLLLFVALPLLIFYLVRQRRQRARRMSFGIDDGLLPGTPPYRNEPRPLTCALNNLTPTSSAKIEVRVRVRPALSFPSQIPGQTIHQSWWKWSKMQRMHGTCRSNSPLRTRTDHKPVRRCSTRWFLQRIRTITTMYIIK